MTPLNDQKCDGQKVLYHMTPTPTNIFIHRLDLLCSQGPSIYDAHMEGVRLRWTHVNGEGGLSPCGRPHRKLKLESTDVILSSFHAKKLASFLPEFRL